VATANQSVSIDDVGCEQSFPGESAAGRQTLMRRSFVQMQTGRRVIAGSIVGLILLGCGKSDTPELGQVEGTVKLDGSPLPNARVEFHPKKGGRPSVGTTDDDGHFVLEYKTGVNGALVGTHRVRIRTYREGDADAEDESQRAPTPEKIPAKYNAETTLEKQVSPGANDPIDFDLDSKGKIVVPGKEQSPRRRQTQDCT
jgi:hypothetical protein